MPAGLLELEELLVTFLVVDARVVVVVLVFFDFLAVTVAAFFLGSRIAASGFGSLSTLTPLYFAVCLPARREVFGAAAGGGAGVCIRSGLAPCSSSGRL